VVSTLSPSVSREELSRALLALEDQPGYGLTTRTRWLSWRWQRLRCGTRSSSGARGCSQRSWQVVAGRWQRQCGACRRSTCLPRL